MTAPPTYPCTSITTTDIDGTSHFESYSEPPPGGLSSVGDTEADSTFHDYRRTTQTFSLDQSGGYGDEGTASSSSTLSVTFVDEFFSESEGEVFWDIGSGDLIETAFSNETEGTTTHHSVNQEEFTPAGNSASWSTEFDRERSWSFDSSITMFGYTITVNESGSESYSEESGAQSYTPNEGDNPSNNYDGTHRPYGGGGEEGEGGEGNGDGAPGWGYFALQLVFGPSFGSLLYLGAYYAHQNFSAELAAQYLDGIINSTRSTPENGPVAEAVPGFQPGMPIRRKHTGGFPLQKQFPGPPGQMREIRDGLSGDEPAIGIQDETYRHGVEVVAPGIQRTLADVGGFSVLIDAPEAYYGTDVFNGQELSTRAIVKSCGWGC